MRVLHAIAPCLLLVWINAASASAEAGWSLMVPPVDQDQVKALHQEPRFKASDIKDKRLAIGKLLNTKAPLAQWDRIGPYESSQACEGAKSGWLTFLARPTPLERIYPGQAEQIRSTRAHGSSDALIHKLLRERIRDARGAGYSSGEILAMAVYGVPAPVSPPLPGFGTGRPTEEDLKRFVESPAFKAFKESSREFGRTVQQIGKKEPQAISLLERIFDNGDKAYQEHGFSELEDWLLTRNMVRETRTEEGRCHPVSAVDPSSR